MDESRPKSTSISSSTFLLTSLGIFSTGTAVGVLYMARTEAQTFNMKANFIPINLAFRAFTLGTLLCAGTAVGVISITSVAFGLRSFQDIRHHMEAAMISKEVRIEREQQLRKEMKEVKGMTVDEELDYYNKKLFAESTSQNDNQQK